MLFYFFDNLKSNYLSILLRYIFVLLFSRKLSSGFSFMKESSIIDTKAEENNTPSRKSTDNSCQARIGLINAKEADKQIKTLFSSKDQSKHVTMRDSFREAKPTIEDRKKSLEVIYNILEYLVLSRGLEKEGIFRKSVVHIKMIEISRHIEVGLEPNFKEYNAYELCNGVKAYIRDTHNGLFGKEIFLKIINSNYKKENVHTLLCCLISLLDEETSTLFLTILRVLGFTAKMKVRNKMSAYNLAVVFTPVFIGKDIMKCIQYEQIIEFSKIVTQFIEIFDKNCTIA
ncbi:RhoGAP domain protein [Spraguea lophii 42_110]|uniref:RhoGAP domain protein n=1 Tax=Spraguea lophii (strain 42_110) TaxID=1358809 RepID=S7XK53_SPRLO|nr:RhoGAP domain protein [Spraguea lophii 42_110]